MHKENRYIDIHSHILPGVDDGAADIEQSKQMLRQAYAEGIQTVIATPHYIPGHERSMDFVREQFQRVEVEAKKIAPDLTLYLGNEIYYDCGCLEAVKEKKALTLANSRYVLIEFSIKESFDHIYEGLNDFILSGYLPILAHMERYGCLYKREDRVRKLIELGCYMQVNSNRICGSVFDQKAWFVRQLITHGLIHFIATDAHNMDQRKPRMESALKQVSKKLERGAWEALVTTNPLHVIQDKYI